MRIQVETKVETESGVEWSGWQRFRTAKWVVAFLQVFPLFLAIHLLIGVFTLFMHLFIVDGGNQAALVPLRSLLNVWNHWDSGHFVAIATGGYDSPMRTAFFPLYPLLMSGFVFFGVNPFLAGLVISNAANLGVMVVFYQLIQEEFGHEHAKRAVLYLSIFPTAFFLSAVYNESLFLFIMLLCFYQIRHQRWWFAGLFGLLASLTRSAGILLCLPFIWEYCRHYHVFQRGSGKSFWRRSVHPGLFAIVLIPLGVVIFASYCYYLFGDFLSFAHTQVLWFRVSAFPLYTIFLTLQQLPTLLHGMSFSNLHNLRELLPTLFTGVLLVLAFIGPWRLKAENRVYGVYGVIMYIFILSVPAITDQNPIPLQSVSRFCVENFPIFLILAAMGEKKNIHNGYLITASFFLSFLMFMFLRGGWMV